MWMRANLSHKMQTLNISTSVPGQYEIWSYYCKSGFRGKRAKKLVFNFDHPERNWYKNCVVKFRCPPGIIGMGAPDYVRVWYYAPRNLRELYRSL